MSKRESNRRKSKGGSFTRLHGSTYICTPVEECVQHTHTHTQCTFKKGNTKHKDLELAKYGEGNVNMGAGSGETCVQKGEGDRLDKLQPAT